MQTRPELTVACDSRVAVIFSKSLSGIVIVALFLTIGGLSIESPVSVIATLER